MRKGRRKLFQHVFDKAERTKHERLFGKEELFKMHSSRDIDDVETVGKVEGSGSWVDEEDEEEAEGSGGIKVESEGGWGEPEPFPRPH